MGVSNKLSKEGLGAQAVCSRVMVCLGYFSIAEIKHYDHMKPGEERVYSSLQLSGHIPSLREVRAGT